jgi:uncharacterized protein (TIGR00369 family)
MPETEPSPAGGVPAGFTPHQRQSPLTDPWQPLFSRTTEQAVIIGVHAENQHCNSRGFVHGGLISTLVDNAMGLSCALFLDDTITGLVTVNLSVDFLRAVNIGEWLQLETTFVRPGSTLCFAQAFATGDGSVCARASAVFRVLGPR